MTVTIGIPTLFALLFASVSMLLGIKVYELKQEAKANKRKILELIGKINNIPPPDD